MCLVVVSLVVCCVGVVVCRVPRRSIAVLPVAKEGMDRVRYRTDRVSLTLESCVEAIIF